VTINRKTWKLEAEIRMDGFRQTPQILRVNRYRFGYDQPRCSGSGFWTGLKPNQTIFMVRLWTAGGLPQPVANSNHVDCRMVIRVWSAWKCLLWRRVTVPLRWMILNRVFCKLTVFANCMARTISQWFWTLVTALLQWKWATRWNQIHCLQWRSFCRHALLHKDSGKLL